MLVYNIKMIESGCIYIKKGPAKNDAQQRQPGSANAPPEFTCAVAAENFWRTATRCPIGWINSRLNISYHIKGGLK